MRRRQSFATILVGKSILLREGLAKILRSANFRILASVSCADDVLPSKLQSHQPLGDLVSAFRAGADGYLFDIMTCDVFIKSVELVVMGETIFPPAFLSFVLGPDGEQLAETVLLDEKNEAILFTTEDTLTPQLSPREKSILHCLIEGDSNKCIARKIDIAEATVKVHVKAILRKIRVQNRTQAAIWGMNNGSLTRPANDSSPLSNCVVSQRLPNPVEAISEIKQIGASVPLGVIEHEANHVEVPRIDRLIRKGINRRSNGAAGPGK